VTAQPSAPAGGENVHSTEGAAARYADRLQRLLVDLLDEVYVVDFSSGRFAGASSSAASNTGYSQTELLKLGPKDVFDTTGRSQYGTKAPLVAECEIEQASFAAYMVRRDGTSYPVGVVLGAPFATSTPQLLMLVTDRARFRRDEHERAYLHESLDLTKDMVVVADRSRSIVYVNDAFRQRAGYQGTEALGYKPEILDALTEHPGERAEAWARAREGHTWSAPATARSRSGEALSVQLTISPILDEDGEVLNYVVVLHEAAHATPLRPADRSPQVQAEITGAMARARSARSPLEALGEACAQVSHLNDVTVAAVLAFREGDIAEVVLARPDAGEVPGPAAGDGPALRRRAEAGAWAGGCGAIGHEGLSHTKTRPGGCPAVYAPIHGSSGVAGVLCAVLRPGVSPGDQQATLATVQQLASMIGAIAGNEFSRWARRTLTADAISEILEEHAFWPVFQPIIDLEDDATAGWEAFTRFADGTPPADRFRDADEAGVGLILEEATLAAAVLASANLPEGGWLSLNVSSAMVMERERLYRGFARLERPAVLELGDLPPWAFAGQVDAALHSLPGGVKLAVDGAGGMSASLLALVHFQPSFIKVDPDLIHGIDHDPIRRALVAGMQKVADQTGCFVVAEGIETEAELLMCKALRIRYGQGHYMGAPAPLPQAEGA
jgi:PAS domain S-box-containing protein